MECETPALFAMSLIVIATAPTPFAHVCIDEYSLQALGLKVNSFRKITCKLVDLVVRYAIERFITFFLILKVKTILEE